MSLEITVRVVIEQSEEVLLDVVFDSTKESERSEEGKIFGPPWAIGGVGRDLLSLIYHRRLSQRRSPSNIEISTRRIRSDTLTASHPLASSSHGSFERRKTRRSIPTIPTDKKPR